MTDLPSDARNELRTMLGELQWLFRVRPMPLAEMLLKLVAPADRRRCLETRAGVRMFVDPLSNLGRALVEHDEYEPEIVKLFEERVHAGATIVDIGANEGFFAAIAGKLAGDRGRVIAVEPQRRLQGLLEVNLRLNGVAQFSIVPAAVGERVEQRSLFLAPSLNHGASSFNRRSRFWFRHQDVNVITAEELFRRERVEIADLVKIDVEGVEDEVVRSLAPLCRAGRVRTLLLDYHAAILERRGISARSIHQQLLDSGMRTSSSPDLAAYVVYERE